MSINNITDQVFGSERHKVIMECRWEAKWRTTEVVDVFEPDGEFSLWMFALGEVAAKQRTIWEDRPYQRANLGVVMVGGSNGEGEREQDKDLGYLCSNLWFFSNLLTLYYVEVGDIYRKPRLVFPVCS